MELLTKASLNNQIVTMRHIVRKSKVHTINKLSREAKKLKDKKGNEEQIIKNKKKSERFVNELMVIKKLNDDVVTKYALQNEVPSATVLNSIDITLETRALARLAGHKFIIDAVQCFRNKYPDWKLYLTELLNELGAKYRGRNKPTKKKTIKVKPKTHKNVDKTILYTEEFEGTQSLSTDVTESEGYETDSIISDEALEETQIENLLVEKVLPNSNNPGNGKDQNNELKVVLSNKPNTVNEDENKKSLSICDKSTKYSIVKENILETPQLPKLVNTQIERNSNISTIKSVDIIAKYDNKLLKRKPEQGLLDKDNHKKKRHIIDEIKPICETVDSFFMTTDDKDYMSVYKPPPTVERNFTERPKLEYQKSRKEIFIKGKKLTSGRQNNVGNRRERRQQVEEPVDTVLHPSWEAKRKQKILAKFEGKKIIFDDQD